MSYEISLGLLQDVSRISDKKQSYLLNIQSYNHTFMKTTPVPLSHPDWDYSYAFLGSQKEVIKFHLCTLDYDRYMEEIAVGKFDIRDYIQVYKPQKNFQFKLILDSSYRNQVLLHLRCEYKDQFRSRNDGLLVTKTPRISQDYNRNNQIKLNNQKITVSSREIHQDRQIFFKGPCQTRNFFSFLDPIVQGQSYNFLQPSKK